MGGIAGYVEDDIDVFMFPQVLGMWRNRAIVEMGPFFNSEDPDRTAGVNIRLPNLGVDGALYVNRPPQIQLRDEYFDITNSTRMNHLVIAGDRWGITGGFGSDQFKDEEPDTVGTTFEKERATFFGFGGGLTLGDPEAMRTDLGARADLVSGKMEFVNSDFDREESGFNFLGSIRNFYKRGGNAGRFISIVTFEVGSSKFQFDQTDFEDKISTMEFGFGLGWEYPVTNDVLVVLVCEPFSMYRAKNEITNEGEVTTGDDVENTFSVMTFPAFFVGVEGHLGGAFTGRAGVGQNFQITKEKEERTPDGGTTTTTFDESWGDSNFAVTLGLGVKLGKHFWLDGVFNDQFLYWGPDFVSGQGDDTPGGPIISRVSAGVIWD